MYFYSQYCCLINWINDGHMNFGILNVVVLLATTHIATKHSSPDEYILFFRGLILHTSLRINALIEVLMTFKSYEGFFGAPGAIGEWSL